MSSLHGLDELVKRVERIQYECGSADRDRKSKDDLQKDEFLRLKQGMYSALYAVLEAIRERQALQRKHGNCIEAIQKRAFIDDKLKQLDGDLRRMQEVYRLQSQKKHKFTDEELESRFQDVQVLKKKLEEAKATYRNQGTVTDDELKTITEMRRGLGLNPQTGVPLDLEAGDSGREPTEEEKAAMGKWQQRDQDFDRQLEVIGDGVDRLGQIAERIGQTAQKQNVMLSEVHKKMDKNNTSVQQLNQKIKKVMSSQKNSTFFCRLVLVIVLLGCIGFVYQQSLRKK